jgi:hypothetical protein
MTVVGGVNWLYLGVFQSIMGVIHPSTYTPLICTTIETWQNKKWNQQMLTSLMGMFPSFL